MFSLGVYSTVCLITGGSLVPVLPDYHLSFIFLLFIPGWIFADSSPADDGSSDLMEYIVTIRMVNVFNFSKYSALRLFWDHLDHLKGCADSCGISWCFKSNLIDTYTPMSVLRGSSDTLLDNLSEDDKKWGFFSLIVGGRLVPVLPDYHLSLIFLLFIPG